MSDTNTALKGMLIGIATVALPVAGFVAGRRFNEDAARREPVPAVTVVKSIDKPCPACPTCPAPTATIATSPPPASASVALPSGGLGPGEGTLIVECAPSCVSIAIDGKEVGPSPLAGQNLPAGKHRIFGKFAAGSPRIADAVIVAGQTARVSLMPAAAPRDDEPKGGGEGCNPPYWVQEDGTHLQKPACR